MFVAFLWFALIEKKHKCATYVAKYSKYQGLTLLSETEGIN